MKYYVLVDIGCIECGEESAVIGIYTSKKKAQRIRREHEKRQNESWNGQHIFEIFEIDEIDKTYKIEYENVGVNK